MTENFIVFSLRDVDLRVPLSSMDRAINKSIVYNAPRSMPEFSQLVGHEVIQVNSSGHRYPR